MVFQAYFEFVYLHGQELPLYSTCLVGLIRRKRKILSANDSKNIMITKFWLFWKTNILETSRANASVKLHCQVYFGCKKVLGPNKFKLQKMILGWKNFVSKKMMCPKEVLAPYIFWVRKKLKSTTVLVQQNFGRQKISVKKNFGQKYFGFKKFWIPPIWLNQSLP